MIQFQNRSRQGKEVGVIVQGQVFNIILQL